MRENILQVAETWKEHRSKCSSITPSKLRKFAQKFRPSERTDGPVMGDELIPAFHSEIKSENEEENIDQR